MQSAEPVRVQWMPSRVAEPSIVDPLMGPTAFPVKIGSGVRGNREVKFLGQPGIQGALLKGSGVRDVPDPVTGGIWKGEQMQDRTGGVTDMDLIDPPAVRGGWLLSPYVNHSPSPKEILQEKGASGAVEACKPSHKATSGEGFVFSLPEDAAGLPLWLGRTGFVHPFTFNLGIYAGAGGEKETVGPWKGRAEVPAPFQVNRTV